MSRNIHEIAIKRAVAEVLDECAQCRARMDEESVSLLGHHDDLWFLSIICPACGVRSMAAALVREREPVTLTDLTPEELARFAAGPRVAADDVLGIHEFLGSFDGDFANLFRHDGDVSSPPAG